MPIRPTPIRPMPRRTARFVSVLLLAGSLAVAGNAMAQRQDGRARDPAQPMQSVPPRSAQDLDNRIDHRRRVLEDRMRESRMHEDRGLSAAVRRVERRTGGQVLSAERVPFEGRSLNRIKVVDSTGRVRIYMDDPRDARPPTQRQEPPVRGGQRTRGDDN